MIASLDVTNLYGSIPINRSNNIFEIASEFFQKYKKETPISELTKEDFSSLLELCLSSDIISINGKAHKQVNGLAMGNNVAPTLATIFMNFVEHKILEALPNIIFWKRYLDDVFIIYENMNNSVLLEGANAAHPSIRFKIENMEDNQISFLYMMISIKDGRLQSRLFMKAAHSGHILPWVSHHPRQTKIGVAIGEFMRAERLSTNSTLRKKSFHIIEEKLRANDYPEWVIRKARNRACEKRAPGPKTKLPTMVLPFISDAVSKQCFSLVRRAGLQDKLRICFRSRTLSSLLRPPRPNVLCDDNCATCSCAEKPRCCFCKGTVYLITCIVCNEEYVGETGRSMHSRIREHYTRSSSAVFRHLLQHGDPEPRSIRWRILHRNLPFTSVRRRVELHEIQSRCPSINSLDFDS